MEKPLLILVAGRPGAGKTTISEKMSRMWHLPLVSRDAVKEGMVHTFGPEVPNLDATNAFFETLGLFVERGVSCVAEAAFRHGVWAERLAPFMDRARVHMVICRTDAETALRRFLKRGLSDPSRLHYHGDIGVRMAMRGETPAVSDFDEPHPACPLHIVDTTDGYTPGLEELARQIGIQAGPPIPGGR